MQHVVRQIKPEALCQLHICKRCVSLLSPSLYLSLRLPLYAPTSPQADRDLSLARANQLSQHDHVPPTGHMKPWGDLLSWLPPEEEAAGDMLAWEETVQFLAGVLCEVCVCVYCQLSQHDARRRPFRKKEAPTTDRGSKPLIE